MSKAAGLQIKSKLSGETSTAVNTVVSSFEEDDEVKVVNIMNVMDLKCYIKLRRYFFNPALLVADGVPKSSEKEILAIGESLSRNEFVSAMEKIIGQSGIAASRLFDEVDRKQSGYILWQEFLDHSLQLLDQTEALRRKSIISKKSVIHEIKHFTETDGIAKIMPLRIGSDQNYEVVSNRGLVRRYNAKFMPLSKSEYSVPRWRASQEVTSCVHIPAHSLTSAPKPLQSSKVAQPWITDATFMNDVNVIIFAVSDRSLHFRDVGGRGIPWMFHISGLRNLPTCMAYMSPTQSSSSEGLSEPEKGDMSNRTSATTTNLSETGAWTDSTLLIGDDMGNIWTLKFLRPHESLFHRRRRKGEGTEHVHWLDLERGMNLGGCLRRREEEQRNGGNLGENPHRKYVELSVAWGVHTGAISQVSFCGSTPLAVASCSSEDRLPLGKGARGGGSLVLKTESSRALPYIFKIPSGISCFDLWENEKGLDCFLLATGSSDALIRLWNPYDPRKATSNLPGHKHPIKDVKFLRRADLMILISICSNAEIMVWKTSDGGCHENSCCLQMFPINFSALTSWNKTPQFGSKVLYVQENHTITLLVVCSKEVATIEFSSDGESDSLERDMAGDDSNSDEQWHQGLGAAASSGAGISMKDDAAISQVPHRASRRLSVFLRATAFTKPTEKFLGRNQRQSLQQKYEKEMMKYVSLCTPHLALPIYPPVFVASQPSVRHSNQ